jgi:hypothetical protein
MAISADTIRPGFDNQGRESFVVASGVTIYAGSYVALAGPGHASAGYLVKYLPDTANLIPLGFSLQNVVGDGVKTCSVNMAGGVLKGITVGGVTGNITDVGKVVYLSDDGTFTVTAPTTGQRRARLGFIVRFVTPTTFDVMCFSAAQLGVLYAATGGAIPAA